MHLLRFLAYCALCAFTFFAGLAICCDVMERIWGRPQSRPPVVPSPRPPTELRLAGGSTYTARTTWTDPWRSSS